MRSKINEDVVYDYTGEIYSDDMGIDANMKNMNVKNIPIEVVLGNPKKSYIKYGIIFIPIYIVYSVVDEETKEEDYSQEHIGVFELKAGEFGDRNLIDEDGDFIIEKLGEPLIFEHVTIQYLLERTSTEDASVVDSESDSDVDSVEEITTQLKEMKVEEPKSPSKDYEDAD